MKRFGWDWTMSLMSELIFSMPLPYYNPIWPSVQMLRTQYGTPFLAFDDESRQYRRFVSTLRNKDLKYSHALPCTHEGSDLTFRVRFQVYISSSKLLFSVFTLWVFDNSFKISGSKVRICKIIWRPRREAGTKYTGQAAACIHLWNADVSMAMTLITLTDPCLLLTLFKRHMRCRVRTELRYCFQKFTLERGGTYTFEPT